MSIRAIGGQRQRYFLWPGAKVDAPFGAGGVVLLFFISYAGVNWEAPCTAPRSWGVGVVVCIWIPGAEPEAPWEPLGPAA